MIIAGLVRLRPQRGGRMMQGTSIDKALRATEIRYRRLFEAAQDGILLLNATTGQIEDVNPFLIRLLGYSYDEFLGKKLWEIGSFKDKALSKEAFGDQRRAACVSRVRQQHLRL
jgi:PAS domain S-box-containing protein